MFTIVDTAIGAFLLYQATKDLYFNHDGSILGVGGMLRTLRHRKDPVIACFFVGMALSHGAMRLIAPEVLPKYPNMNWDLGTILFALITSILVGWGTKVRYQKAPCIGSHTNSLSVAAAVHQSIYYAGFLDSLHPP